MIEVHLYGKLCKRYGSDKNLQGNVLRLTPEPGETMASVFERAGIETQDVYSLFLNAKLLAARSNMVRWLGYQQTGNDPLSWDMTVRVSSGDRIGVFGRDMAALVV
jgi:hypothetical protein